MVGTESEWLATQNLEANTEFRHSMDSQIVSCDAICSKGKDGGGAYSRGRLTKVPPDFGGGREV